MKAWEEMKIKNILLVENVLQCDNLQRKTNKRGLSSIQNEGISIFCPLGYFLV